MPTSPANSVSLEDLVHRNQVEVPKLTEEQYRDAITVILADYWSLNCWTCNGRAYDFHVSKFDACPTVVLCLLLFRVSVQSTSDHARLATPKARETGSQDSRTSRFKCPSPAKP